MSDLIRDFIIKFKRLRHCMLLAIKDLEYEDFKDQSSSYISACSLFKKMQEIRDILAQLADDNPGVLTQDQIDSISQSVMNAEREFNRIKIKPVKRKLEVQQRDNLHNDDQEEMESNRSRKSTSSEATIIVKKRNIGSMSLRELRESLGLDSVRAEMSQEKEHKLQEDLKDEILESTTRMRHIGNALTEQIKEGNTLLDDVQAAAESNLQSVQSQNTSIKTLRSSSWWTILRDLKYFALALVLFFFCGFVVVLLPKAK